MVLPNGTLSTHTINAAASYTFFILLASCKSFGIMVMHLACMPHKLVSLNNSTSYTSEASCRALIVSFCNCRSVLKSWAISWTSLKKGNFRMSSSVYFWYLLISRSATIPGYVSQWSLQTTSIWRCCLLCTFDCATC